MTINNPAAFCASLWDWGCLDGCFGNTKIKPTDWDGIVERHGYFLLIETKLPGVGIPDGQNEAFESAIKTGVFTVVIVWGHPGIPEQVEVRTRHGDIIGPRGCDIKKLRSIVSDWYSWADKQTNAPIFSELDHATSGGTE